MSDEVRDRFGRRIIPPAELPPGAIGWNVYEHEPAPLGQPSKAPPEFIGFIPAASEPPDSGLEATLVREYERCSQPVPEPPACSPDHRTQCGDIEIGDNQDRDCLSLYQDDVAAGVTDTIHICDWPALKAAVDQHQRERGGST